ncbi:dihydrofolate reductase family protein [Kitasatospora griseola]|uniref:dihydrofolate reductase family protein n=1 Tax=Kitasatospora griseola TaxID=2064 RepID=UPI00166FF832|nr:dihydrofolate reductase family protein [Kitasatospora griseola]GGR05027.1 riboflavin biosynthesis protein RibD [Kitasatospora griseola]
MSVIVIGFTTLDGRVTDPDGSGGTPGGGWMFRYGPEHVSGDKFRLGATLDDGVLLLGRRTWQHFATLWPTRDDPFSTRMNAAAKLVATRTLTGASAWANSRLLEGDLLTAVKAEQRDVVVTGSVGVVHQLIAADLVDEYRILTVPVVLGVGARLFPDGASAADLRCVQAEQVGPMLYARYRRS